MAAPLGRIWHAWTLLYTVPFVAAGAGMLWLEPLSAPVALAALAHAWIIPELYAFRGASVVRPKGPRNEDAEPVAQGLLGDLLGHDERDLQRETGLALEQGGLGVWLVGEAGALLVTPGGSRVHCFCVRATEPSCRPRTAWRTCCSRCAWTRRVCDRRQPRLRRCALARAAAAARGDAAGPEGCPPGRSLASPR